MIAEMLEAIAVPRPNGSAEFYRVAEYIKGWLAGRGLPVETHTFWLRPYALEIAAGLLLILALLFFYLAFSRKTWLAALPAALIGLLLLFELILGTPVVSGAYRRTGENIVVSFQPEEAARELILTAHYDSKTQIFDHRQRELIYRLVIPSVAGGVLLALLWWLLHLRGRRPRKAFTVPVGVLLAALPAYWLILALAFGGGFLARPSPGAVDDGAAVVVLMQLAEELKEMPLENTAVTIVFFAGEELGMQGSQAYLKDFPRDGGRPAYNLNLELLCQEGPYVCWVEDGVYTTRYDTCGELNDLLDQAVFAVTEERLQHIEDSFTTISDSGTFLAAGLRSTTLGNAGSAALGMGAFHTHLDNRGRIIEERIPEALQILKEFVLLFEKGRPI